MLLILELITFIVAQYLNISWVFYIWWGIAFVLCFALEAARLDKRK